MWFCDAALFSHEVARNWLFMENLSNAFVIIQIIELKVACEIYRITKQKVAVFASFFISVFGSQNLMFVDENFSLYLYCNPVFWQYYQSHCFYQLFSVFVAKI